MKLKLSLNLDTMWVLDHRDDDVLPMSNFIHFLTQEFKVTKIVDEGLIGCEIIVETVDDAISIKDKCWRFMTETYNVKPSDNIVEMNIDEVAEAEAESVSEEKAVVKNEERVETTDSDKKGDDEADGLTAIEKIHALVGAEEFKKMADEVFKVAPLIKKHNSFPSFLQQHYLFSINNGNGLSTYLSLFSELLSELGLFNCEKVIEEKVDMSNTPFSRVKSLLSKSKIHTKGKIISIDISDWMTKITEKDFRDFLSDVDDAMGDSIVVFRVPFVEKDVLNDIKKGINDILLVRDISFVPFNNDELKQYASQLISEMGFVAENDIWPVFDAKIADEKNDGRFYGLNTVKKIIREMIYHKHINNVYNDVDDNVIKKNEILSLATLYEDDKNAYEMLDDMVGMEILTEKVKEIVAQIEASLKNPKLKQPCIHMRFVGNPGTGKTTVARVVGKVLKEKGILRNGSFFEHSGRDFCGRYVGETAPKTAAMCRDAYGSVLFIDEAYTLYRGDGNVSTADYGVEAIDTLIAEMENHRSDLVVIMAGYPDQMASLMQANPGLESRMPYVIEFPNYSRSELGEIYIRLAKSAFTFDEDFEKAVREYFESLPNEVIYAKDFSNARFVRNLFERTWGKAIMRSQLTKDESMVLTKEDFVVASSEKEFAKIMKKRNRTLGFI